MSRWTRRDFLQTAATGTAVVTAPAWLTACGAKDAAPVAAAAPTPLPDDPFLT